MAVSGRKHCASIGRNREIPTGRYQTDKEQLEDLIMLEKGVQATVEVMDERVTIRTTDYADYVLARVAIKGRVSQPIFRA